MKKKYLSEMMKDTILDKSTLIIAPTGSGKTHFILNDLCKDKKVLYLCDNSNLEEQVSLEDCTKVAKSDLVKKGFGNTEITIMTYKYFGTKIKFDIDYDYLKEFELIVADEIHNLVDYYAFSRDEDLSHALVSLLKFHNEIPVLMFTATPYYLDELSKKYEGIDKYFDKIDFSKSKEIMRYVSLSTVEFSSYKQIPKIFECNRENFEYFGKKALIYTTSIETMKTIENTLQQEYLKPICVWSLNNEKNDMTLEQKEVRNHLLSTGELLSPYNVLIINRAMETGVNIYDKDMMYCVINTTNLTQQAQARGRIRHDIVELRLRNDNYKAGQEVILINLEDEWLDRPLTREDKNILCKRLGLYDRSGRLMKWNTIKKVLISKNNGYKIEDNQITIGTNRRRISIINSK